MAYVVISFYIATMLVYVPQKPPYSTPAAFGLQYRNVTFPSREDHIQLRGWLIPGVLPGGTLTVQRSLIADNADAGLLGLGVGISVSDSILRNNREGISGMTGVHLVRSTIVGSLQNGIDACG